MRDGVRIDRLSSSSVFYTHNQAFTESRESSLYVTELGGMIEIEQPAHRAFRYTETLA